METKYRAETKGKATQRLSHLRIHPIYSYQTQTLLWMPRSACRKEPDMAVSWEALPEPYKYRGEWMLTAYHWTEHEVSNGRARESNTGVEGVCSLWGRIIISTNQTPQSSQRLNHQLRSTHGRTYYPSHICTRAWPCWASMGDYAHGPVKARCPRVGEVRVGRLEWVGRWVITIIEAVGMGR